MLTLAVAMIHDHNSTMNPPIMRPIGSRLKKAPPRRPRGHYSLDDQLTILWGISQNWTNERIGKAIGGNPRQIEKYRDQVTETPTWIFELPVLVRLTERKYECQFCGGTREEGVLALKHVLAHFFRNDVVETISLSGVEIL